MSDTHKGVISCPPEVLRRAAVEFAANAADGIREETMLDALDRFHDMFRAHILITMWLERAVSFGWRDGELEIHSTPAFLAPTPALSTPDFTR